MSSTYSKNKKELSGVKVVSASKVWRKNYKNGKFSLRKDIDILGKVELPLSNFVLKANNEDRKTGKFLQERHRERCPKAELFLHTISIFREARKQVRIKSDRW